MKDFDRKNERLLEQWNEQKCSGGAYYSATSFVESNEVLEKRFAKEEISIVRFRAEAKAICQYAALLEER